MENISSSSTAGAVEDLAVTWIHFTFAVTRSREVGSERRVIIAIRSTVCESAQTSCPRGVENANASQ